MRSPFLPALACIAALALTACASTQREDPKSGALTPTQQWDSKIKVETYPDEVLLALRQDGLSAAQADALQGLLERWTISDSQATIRLRVPSRTDRPGEGDAIARAARDFLVARGAPAWRVELASYDASGAPPGASPLVVAFDRHQVVTPLCGTDMGNMSRSASNQPMPNFGCAVTANLAAQIADPGDLLAPRGMDLSDAGRRSTVLGKYRNGELTASQREEQASGAVSKAVN